MTPRFEKNSTVRCQSDILTNIYGGTQFNCSAGSLSYNYKTDVFKDYGFDTALKWTAPTDKTNVQYMAYSYICRPDQTHAVGQEYTISLYAYVSPDCNANFRLHLEHSNAWLSNYQGTAANINDSTKGKVIWVWGRCKANSDGNIYIMFYPNPYQTNIFTTGYQLFAGITVYYGTELYRPMNKNISGSGMLEGPSLSIGKNYITANNYIEF